LPSALKQIFDNSDDAKDDASRPSLPLSYIDDNSFLSFDTREGNKPGELIGNSLRIGIKSFQRLRILDLEHVFRPQLPNNIGNLHDLWYLGLRWTYLESIPSSIGNLTNLQTLDMKHTYIREVPGSIWRLKKLQHLYLNHNYRSKIVHHRSANSLRNLPIVMSQPRSNSPKNLQTLWGVFIDEDSFLKDQLDKLTSLEKLGLAFQLTSSQEKTLECIVGLNKLKSLELRSIDETGEPQNLYLKSLENLPNLSNLYLFGRLEIPSIISKFPEKLSYLTLSASGLKDDPMPTLGKLPNLKSLCFYSGSYKGIEMVCWDGFPQLLVLKLWKLEFLEKLQVEDKAMQNLTELEIRCCDKLEVPTGLKYLKSLQELKLTNMPETFTARIERKKWQIWNDIALSPMIIKDNW
jgi:Leucine-rich repeat (LRR) protein